MRYAIVAALLLAAAPAAQAQVGGIMGGYLAAEQQRLQNQLLQQQIQQMQAQPSLPLQGPEFHTYQFPGGSLHCTTILQGTPAATTTCR